MASTSLNPDVKQKDCERAVVVAITSGALFGPEDTEGVLRPGVAFPLLQALQRVNKRLLEEDPAESLLFDVILVTTDDHQEQSDRIISSTRHHGLEVGRFCFSSKEDFIESLLKNNVRLFLSTDRNQVALASQRGVISALLEEHTASPPSEQLRILFCGDAIVQPEANETPASKEAAKTFLCQLGEIRRRFGPLDSPLSITVMTSHGGRESCGSALRRLRSFGISADEAYCLAGAPRDPILSVLRPHFLLTDGFSCPQD